LHHDFGKFLQRTSTPELLGIVDHNLDAKYTLAFGIDLQRQLTQCSLKIVGSYVGFSTDTSHSADWFFRLRYLGRRW